MAATTIFFNGVLTSRPGSYSEVDATALETVGLGASGIVALVGLGVGGRPYSAVLDPANDFQRYNNTGKVFNTFRSGDLREMAIPLLNPSNDDAIQSGAQEIVFVKVNPATQSEATFPDAGANDALKLTSADWGLFTTQINALIEDATAGAPAKRVTVNFEDQTEVFDDLGATGKFTLTYNGDAQRMTADVTASALSASFERDDLGQDGLVTTQATGGASLEIISSDVGDTTQTVTVYGLNASGQPQSQTATLNGTSAVAVPGTWNLQTGVALSAAAAGTVTVRNAAGAVVVFDVPPATLTEGLASVDIPVDDVNGGPTTLTMVADAATTQQVVVRGFSQTLAPLAEAITLNGTTPVALTGLFGRITQIELADLEAARTATVAGLAVNAPFASISNLQQLTDKIQGLSPDFTVVSLVSDPKAFTLSDLDIATATDVRDPATGTFFARLADVAAAINAGSVLVTATVEATGEGAPANTPAPVFLTGGHEGDAGNPGVPTAQASDWQSAIDLLQRIRVNTLCLGPVDQNQQRPGKYRDKHTRKKWDNHHDVQVLLYAYAVTGRIVQS
jgi:hypothetical protein